jgi:hypothetical protein
MEKEKVLCYHGPVLYEAKVMHVILTHKDIKSKRGR